MMRTTQISTALYKKIYTLARRLILIDIKESDRDAACLRTTIA